MLRTILISLVAAILSITLVLFVMISAKSLFN